MNLESEITKYESLPSQLIGKTLKSVSYFEIDCGKVTFELSDHHSLDYGLQLETDNGETYYMIWDSQYFQYDLKFKKGKLNQELNPDAKISCHDVSESNYWSDRIGQKLRSIRSYWSYVMTDGKSKKKYYPQDIELTFENGLSVVVSAIEISQDGQVSGMADHISVFFDSETAKKYGARNEINLIEQSIELTDRICTPWAVTYDRTENLVELMFNKSDFSSFRKNELNTLNWARFEIENE